jgi:2-succinyl-6-hydroxy-2,4-cyclohexadiene-1-carboxylate synthase
MPVHLISGERDEKFTELAKQMHSAIPQSTLNVITHVGHTVHLENPIATASLLDKIISQQ